MWATMKYARRALPGTACLGSSGVEQWTENPRVGGSIPPLGTMPGRNAEPGERDL